MCKRTNPIIDIRFHYSKFNVEYNEKFKFSKALPVCQKPRAKVPATPISPGPTCQEGWRAGPKSEFCYRPTPTNCGLWENCQNECIEMESHLTSIHSDEENNFVGQMANETGMKGAWIGGIKAPDSSGGHDNTRMYQGGRYRRGEPIIYRWTDGTPMDYERWNGGQPNNLRGGQGCVEIFTNYKWNDNFW